VRWKSLWALRLQHADLLFSIDARGHHLQHLLQVNRDFPNTDLQKVFANKITQAQACIGGTGSSVGIATDYVLDGPRIESRWGEILSHTYRPALGPNQHPVQWVLGLSRV
jgi:hypothetical protein